MPLRAALWRRDAGQSLIEFALMLPLLLIAFVGVADVGRLFFYTSMISSAAREGAIYAASHSNARLIPNDPLILRASSRFVYRG